jgi:hypothetical protein
MECWAIFNDWRASGYKISKQNNTEGKRLPTKEMTSACQYLKIRSMKNTEDTKSSGVLCCAVQH